MKKRILSAALALLTAFTVMPKVSIGVQAAEFKDIIYYPEEAPGVPIINAELSGWTKFINSEEIKMSMFNAANELGMYYNMKETLDYYRDSTFDRGDFENDGLFWDLLKDNQIAIRFGAKLRGDKHGSVSNHPVDYKYSYQSIKIGNETIKGPNDDSRKFLWSNDDGFTQLKGGLTSLNLKVWSGGCGPCGSPKFSNPVVVFADTVAPYITGYYVTSDDNGGETAPEYTTSNFTTGDKLYIHITFSEPIRFANMSAAHDDLKLGLKLANRYNGTQIQEAVYADVYALRGNVLTFVYNVPEELGGTKPNHKLIGFTGITVLSGDDALYKKDAYTLKIDMQASDPDTVANVIKLASKEAGKTSIKSGEVKNGGYNTADSIITDIAGNSLPANSTFTLKTLVGNTNNPVIDHTAPYVASVDVSLSRKRGSSWYTLTEEVENGKTVNLFAKAGDRVNFKLYISEDTRGAVPSIETNILDANGDWIVIDGNNYSYQRIYGTPYTCSFSYELILTEDMTLPTDEPFAVTSVSSYHDYYWNLSGNRPSNVSEPNKLLPSGNRTLFYDRLNPIITTSLTPEGGFYTVNMIENGEAFGFVDFTITDDTSHGEKQSSGTIQVGDQQVRGSVRFEPAGEVPDEYAGTYQYYNFQYAIVPYDFSLDEISFGSAALGSSYSFNQSPGQQYLYIKLPEGFPEALLPMKVTIECSDFAGNKSSIEMKLDAEYFIELLDKTPPTIVHNGQVTTYTPGTEATSAGSGSITDSFTVSDKRGVLATSIEYALIEGDGEPTESDWKFAQVDGTSAEEYSFSLTQSFTGESDYEAVLYVRATDASTNGNTAVAGPYKLSYHVGSPDVSVVTNAGEYTTSPQLGASAPYDQTNYEQPGAIALIKVTNPDAYGFSDGFGADGHYIIANTKISDDSQYPTNILFTNNWDGYGTFDRESMTFTDLAQTNSPEGSALLTDYARFKTLVASGKYNGILEVEVFYGYGLDYNSAMDAPNVTYQEQTTLTDSQYYTFKYVATWGDASNPNSNPTISEKPFSVNVEWQNVDSLKRNESWTPGSDGIPAPHDLAGAIFDVTITNVVEPSYGMLLLDPEGSYVELLSVDNQNNVQKVLFTQHLSEANTRIIIPEGLEYVDGLNRVRVRVTVQTAFGGIKGVPDTAEFYAYTEDNSQKDLWAYPDELGEFGIAAVVSELETSYLGIPLDGVLDSQTVMSFESTDENGEKVYTRPDRIVLGAYNDQTQPNYTHKLYVTSDASDRTDHYIQLNNITEGVEKYSGAWHHPSTGVDSDGNVDDGSGLQFGSPAIFSFEIHDSIEELNANEDKDTIINYIPLVANMDNLIEYRMIHANGRQSTTYTFTIYPDTTIGETIISITPEVTADEYISSVGGVVEELPIGASLYQYRYNPEDGTRTWVDVTDSQAESTDSENKRTGSEIELTAINSPELSGSDAVEWFVVKDMQGNLDYLTLERPSNLWMHKPVISNESSTVSDTNVAQIALNINLPTASDPDFLSKYGYKLTVAFDDAYTDKLGYGSVSFDIPPADSCNTLGEYESHLVEIGESLKASGIFRIETDYRYGSSAQIEKFYMAHKYNSELEEGKTENVTLTFTVTDAAGNVSEPYTVDCELVNTKPAVTGYSYVNRELTFDGQRTVTYVPTIFANVPIETVHPNSYNPTDIADYAQLLTRYTENGWDKPFVNIYRDGTYEITFEDVFGEVHSQTVTVTAEDMNDSYGYLADLGMDIQFLEPAPETGEIPIVWSTLNSDIRIGVTQSFNASSPSFSYPQESGMSYLDPTLPVYVGRAYKSGENQFTFSSSNVTIIPSFVNTPPQARVEWYFDEFESDSVPTLYDENDNPYTPSVTSENVTAYLVTDRHVNMLNGKSEYHTFTYGGETSYTFEFEDLSGQQGSLTVELPITIGEPIPEPQDTTAPEYSLELYAKYKAALESVESFTPNDSDTIESAIAALDWTQGYMLSFQIADESPTKLIVKAPGTDLGSLTYASAVSDAISGISVTGTQVIIDAAQDFTVVIIDANGNITSVDIGSSEMKFDFTPPYVPEIDGVIKNKTGLFEVTAYVKILDDESGDVKLLYPQGTTKVSGGELDGRYAIVFTTNETISIRFEDALGNQGTHDITVDSIDESRPVVKKVTWKPSLQNDSSSAPITLSNRDVTALVEFSAPIKELDLYSVNGAPLDGVDVLLQDDQAIFTFSKSAHDRSDETVPVKWYIEMNFVSANGVSGYDYLELEPVIDKVAPTAQINYTEDGSLKPFVDIVISGISEDCYMQDTGSKVYKAGESITKRIFENGTYTYRLVDFAGNIGSVSVTVTCVDSKAPVLILDEDTLPAKDALTNRVVTVRATLDEAGTITINGETKSVTAPDDENANGAFDSNECDWVEFTLSENGGYLITAEDNAGHITESYISVTCIDRAAPSIFFNPTTLTYIEGIDRQTVETALMEGITLHDGRSEADKITVTYTAFDDAILSEVGVHEITFTATDEAGNAATARRYVRIYDKDEPQILINGVKTYRGETVIVKSSDITVSIDKLTEQVGEPYSVYIRNGVWREGQMKTRSEKLDSLNFTAASGNYYTLYIVTQSRQTYLTTFYVQ